MYNIIKLFYLLLKNYWLKFCERKKFIVLFLCFSFLLFSKDKSLLAQIQKRKSILVWRSIICVQLVFDEIKQGISSQGCHTNEPQALTGNLIQMQREECRKKKERNSGSAFMYSTVQVQYLEPEEIISVELARFLQLVTQRRLPSYIFQLLH